MKRILIGIVVAIRLLILPSSPLDAQEEERLPPWQIQIGGVAGFHVTCDGCEPPTTGVGTTVGLARDITSGWSLGIAWTGIWFDGSITRQSRNAVEATLSLSAARWASPFLRFGTGTAMGTRVTVDGPPEPPLQGDKVIGIGNSMGWIGSLGAGMKLPLLGHWSLVPEVRIQGQRVDGDEIVTAGVLLSIHVR